MKNKQKTKIYNPIVDLKRLDDYGIKKLNYFECLIDTRICDEDDRRKTYETKNIAILSTTGIILSILFFLLPFSYEKLINSEDELWIRIILIVIIFIIILLIIVISFKSIKGIMSKHYKEIEITKFFSWNKEGIINIKREIIKEKVDCYIENRRTNNNKANYFNESLELFIALFMALIILCFFILYKLFIADKIQDILEFFYTLKNLFI